MYCAAAPAITTTRNNAACTMLRVRTTPMAAPAIANASTQNASCCSHMTPTAPLARPAARSLLALHFCADLERLGRGHRLHPLAELDLVVEQLRDAGLGVLEVGAPEEGVERAHLDADPAV